MSTTLIYGARRLLLTVPVLLSMSVFVFAIIHLTSGDPVQAAFNIGTMTYPSVGWRFPLDG